MDNSDRGQSCRSFAAAFIILATVIVSGCSSNGAVSQAARQTAINVSGSEARGVAEIGVTRLIAGDLSGASQAFNSALKLGPSSSAVHYLNGTTYHMMSARGDEGKAALAEQGLQLAIQFDPTNWMAHYQLGLLYLDQRRFRDAQDSFAEALLFNSDDPDLLYNMAVASYYAKDIQTSSATLKRLRDVEPNSQRTLRASSIAHAALDRGRDAQVFASRLATNYGGVPDEHLARRIDDWLDFHRFASNEDGLEVLNSRVLPGGPVSEQEIPTSTELDLEDLDGDTSSMVVVDIVIIRTEEDVSTSRGVNLLEGLRIQFGNSFGTPAFSRQRSSETVDDTTIDGTTTATTNTTNVTRLITVPALTYSLNIANASSNRAEVLARPTLVAKDGRQSSFFAGVEVDAGTASSDGGEVYSISKDIGVGLDVIPTIRPDGLIDINVTARRTFLNPPSPNISFEFLIEVSKTEVTADVLMREGETLILSGLSETETSNQRSGVPILQDVPIAQYLFSNRTTNDFQKSVLVLITPRRANYVYQHDRARAGQNDLNQRDSAAIRELRAKYSDWFEPYPNTASVFYHMQANSLYREFRTGDVTMERWDNQQSLADRLTQALSFFYY